MTSFGRSTLKIQLTVVHRSTYEIFPQDYDADTPDGQLEEDIEAFRSGQLRVGDFDDFEVIDVTGILLD